ncbi:MAG: hypothetical protein WBQ04_00460 [Candidatus Acidiferrales bacterium]
MVFAVAALLFQFSPVPKMVRPVFRANLTTLTATDSATDGTRPKPASAVALGGETDTVATASGKGYIDPAKLSLGGDAGEKSAAGVTVVSLTDHDTTQPLSSVRIPKPLPVKPIKVYSPEKPRISRSWLALTMMQHGAATFDAYSTRQAIGHGAVEDDPLMRPFAHSGAIYAAIQVGPLLLDYVARRMQHSEYGMVRRMWFVPQSASTAGFLISGVHNLSVASR